jgi:hypothetical protein
MGPRLSGAGDLYPLRKRVPSRVMEGARSWIDAFPIHEDATEEFDQTGHGLARYSEPNRSTASSGYITAVASNHTPGFKGIGGSTVRALR